MCCTTISQTKRQRTLQPCINPKEHRYPDSVHETRRSFRSAKKQGLPPHAINEERLHRWTVCTASIRTQTQQARGPTPKSVLLTLPLGGQYAVWTQTTRQPRQVLHINRPTTLPKSLSARAELPAIAKVRGLSTVEKDQSKPKGNFEACRIRSYNHLGFA